MLQMLVWMWMACGEQENSSLDDASNQNSEKGSSVEKSNQSDQSGKSQNPKTGQNPKMGQNTGNGPKGPPNMNGQPGANGSGNGSNIGPKGPPPNMKGGQVANGSGGAFQDPSGFPPFHDWKAPEGPAIDAMGTWSETVQLTQKPTGGYRAQIAVSNDDLYHVVYYDRTDEGDIIRHRMSRDGKKWSPPQSLGHDSERNWGPDIIVRPDESVVVVYDHAMPDFRSRGYVTTFDPTGGSWSEPKPLTPDDGGEIGSGHVADAVGEDLAYVFIGKPLGEAYRFQAKWRWYRSGEWSEIQSFSDGTNDAWHTNVERRPDGSVVAGFDIGTGGAATTLYFVEGRDGAFGELQNITETGEPGERPHFAFAADTDYVTWFHKESGQPKHIYVRSHKVESNKWGDVEEPSQGYGGFHFDPEIEINKDGVLCLVWGWDAGQDAEMVYSLNRGDGWSAPKKIADVDWGKPGLASLSVDSKGNFHVVWNQGVRGYNEVYYASLEVQ